LRYGSEGIMSVVDASAVERPMNEYDAAARLPSVRARADAAYQGARRRQGVHVQTLDARWQQTLVAISGQPAGVRVRVLTAFTKSTEEQIAELDKSRLKTAASAEAAAAERRAHAFDNVSIGRSYAATVGFTMMVDGQTLV
jgi:hypothetical protein